MEIYLFLVKLMSRKRLKSQKWRETKGVRSVKNAITIKGQTSFKGTAKDILLPVNYRFNI